MNNNGTFMFSLNQHLFETERIFKLSSAMLGADGRLEVKFLIEASVYDKKLSQELKTKVQGIINKLVPESYRPRVAYEKSFSDEAYINRLTREFFYRDQPLIFEKIKNLLIRTEISPTSMGFGAVEIKMEVPQYIFSYLTNQNIGAKIEAFLDTKIMETPEVIFFPLPHDEEKEIVVVKRRPPEAESISTVPVTYKAPILGMPTRRPRYIAEVKNAESERQCVAGVVEQMKEIISKKTNATFFTFKINDTSDNISVKYFPRTTKTGSEAEQQARLDAHIQKFKESVQDGVSVVIEGPIRFDDFSKEYAITLYSAVLGDIDFEEIERKNTAVKPVPDEYRIVFPREYIETEERVAESNLFSDAGLSDWEIWQTLPDNAKRTYVVFDTETTGLSPTKSDDRIIEIGAVKIVDGKLTETFSTFINPDGKKIPPDATKINGIRDEDVENAPLWKDVVPDFYKFSEDAVFVAQNIGFDMSFIAHQSKSEGYIFNNEQICTLELGRRLFPRFKHHKLHDLCKVFEIPLKNAHRALGDAVPTAKVFLKLLFMLHKKSD
ncbi:MAG: exonuclease domain-containing protein [Firmicutes bacterium]|nr:exonuclease domain-containing protein [Bacillota bacterium]